MNQSIKFEKHGFPSKRDKFHEVREIIATFNEHMKKVFIPSWVSCLDESMPPWTRRWVCPGFMRVHRKPYPVGRYHHAVACGVSGALWAMEIVEEGERPPELESSKHYEHVKIGSLLLQLSEAIFRTRKIVVLDSSFCGLQVIVTLIKFGA